MIKILQLGGVLALALGLVGCESVQTEKVYYKDGKTLKAEYQHIKDNEQDGFVNICAGVGGKMRLRGYAKCYYDNGNIERETEWVDSDSGTRSILRIDKGYYKNGNPKWEYSYNSKGNMDGVRRQWYENGQLIYESYYKDSKEDGVFKKWREDGSLISESHYKNGRLDGASKDWYKNGQLEYEQYYKNGAKDGVHKKWYGNGQLEYERHYKNGKHDGVHKEWSRDGSLISESHYKNGEEVK